MKYIYTFIITVCLSCFVLTGCTVDDSSSSSAASSVTSTDGCTYTLSSDGSYYTLSAYSGSDTSLSIATSYYSIPVTAIGPLVFYGNTTLTSVTIPSNITLIDNRAFQDCTALTTVTINGAGAVDIGPCAFKNCTALSAVSLTGVKYLRQACFANCTSLSAVTTPAAVTYFGTNCFFNDTISLSIESTDATAVTMETYAFYFIGTDSTITFSAISSTAASSATATAKISSASYSAGVWPLYWYNIAVTPSYEG